MSEGEPLINRACYSSTVTTTPSVSVAPHKRPQGAWARCALVFVLAFAAGCTGVVRQPVPAHMHLDATVLGRHDLRTWGDVALPPMRQALYQRAKGSLEQTYGDIMHGWHNYLAVSGGGANGAYGAGLLVGWSEAGNRPEFTMVTGVSTGALIAPFAFLGSNYDGDLKKVYTTLDSSRIFDRRSLWSIIRGDSLVDSSPLARALDTYVTDAMVAEIAREYRRGRGLFVGTTNLDAGRPVIWNIGRIADSGDPRAGDLIRDILRASASIPGVFPPVYIRVQGPDGRAYDEMHVDGGASSQMFLYPAGANWGELLEVLDVRGTTAYLIRNSRMEPGYDPVEPGIASIAGRAVELLIRTQGIGDAFRIAANAKRDGIEVKATWIPADAVEDTSDEAFDPVYMQALFDVGYRQALGGKAWHALDIFQTSLAGGEEESPD